MKKFFLPKKSQKSNNTFAFLFFLFMGLFTTQLSYAQICQINAGSPRTICANTVTLTAVQGTNTSGNPTWSLLSFTSIDGSTQPSSITIVTPNALSTNVTGLTAAGIYTFRVTQPCTSGNPATSDVAITAYPIDGFTAGPDVTGTICASTGTVNLTGAVIPPGFTGTWTIENTFKRARYNTATNLNGQLSSTTIANPTFSLINTTNHTEDPTYTLTLTIRSINNPSTCTYSDSRIVAFCPNQNIVVPNNKTTCTNLTGNEFIGISNAPIWATNYPGFTSSGTLSITVLSQPPGASMTLERMETGDITTSGTVFFSGMTQLGTYQFTLTASSCAGTCGSNYTTPTITINLTGIQANNINYTPTDKPEQLAGWLGSSGSNRAGEFHCNLAGTSTPECFYFDINPADPWNLPFTITSNGISGYVLPPGASTPTFTINQASGSRRVEVCVNPGTNGWKAGTYSFQIVSGSGSCGRTDYYLLHVSDKGRTSLTVANQTVCNPTVNPISATINLPPNFLTPAGNPSYFQLFGSTVSYNFTTLSRPSGAPAPTFAAVSDRQLSDATTTIGNLTLPGEYRFRMSIFNGNGSGNYINQDFACSGASDEAEFSIFVEATQGSNAGSAQSFACSSASTLVGNTPTGSNTGLWQLVSKPSGAADPTIVNPTSATTSLTGFDTVGDYTFSWTITTPSGNCSTSSNVTITIQNLAPNVSSVTPTAIVNGNDGTITVTGTGSGTLTYTITKGAFTASNSTGVFTGLAFGIYDVSISNAQCTSTVVQAEVEVDECNALLSGNPDRDGDNVSDICDLDNDNDGLLDTVEGFVPGTTPVCNTTSTRVTGLVAGQNAYAAGGVDANINDGSQSTFLRFNSTSPRHRVVIDLGLVHQAGSVIKIDYSANNSLFSSRNIRIAEVPAGAYIASGGNNPQTVVIPNGGGTFFNDYTLAAATRYVQVELSQRLGGNVDIREATITNACFFSIDTDRDGVADHFDNDSDNDGVPDALEANISLTSSDIDVNGRLNGAVNPLDGVKTIAGSGFTPVDTDGDNISNYRDIDSDNDGIVDVIESQPTVGYVAPTGTVNSFGIDNTFNTVGNGVLTLTLTNTDGADVPDMFDTDSDNDGKTDMQEAAQGTYVAADTDGDGLANVFDLVVRPLNVNGNISNGGQTAISPFPRTESPAGQPNWRNRTCTESPSSGTPSNFAAVGISTHAAKQANWPTNVPNGIIVLESASKGFVITRITTAARDAVSFVPVEGMLIYNTTVNRFQLRKGSTWVNLKRGCIN